MWLPAPNILLALLCLEMVDEAFSIVLVLFCAEILNVAYIFSYHPWCHCNKNVENWIHYSCPKQWTNGNCSFLRFCLHCFVRNGKCSFKHFYATALYTSSEYRFLYIEIALWEIVHVTPCILLILDFFISSECGFLLCVNKALLHAHMVNRQKWWMWLSFCWHCLLQKW